MLLTSAMYGGIGFVKTLFGTGKWLSALDFGGGGM